MHLRSAREARKRLLDAVEEMTSSYPGRVTRSHLSPIENGQAEAEVVLDQIRAVDRARPVRKLGRLEQRTGARVLGVLGEMFAP